MKKGLLKGLVLALIIGLLAACGSNSGDGKKVLKMATSADYPPFESFDAEGNFIGFDIEVAKLVAEELGYELKIENMDFSGLIGALQAKRVDMVLAGMNASEERKKNVDFSIEYHKSGEVFISKADAGIDSLEDLEGKTVGVQLGTIQEEGADKLKDEYNFTVSKLNDATVLIQELITGRIDVAYLDKTVAKGYMDEHGFVGFEDVSDSSPGMAIAFPKGSELIDDVNKALQKLIDSGKIDELKAKWLPEEE